MEDNKFQAFEDIVEEMKVVYTHDKRPWMIGFSGGKDSTMLVMLVFEMLKRLKPSQINKKVYITSSDTMVENPIVKNYMYKMSKLIGEVGEKYGIVSNIITPPADKTFLITIPLIPFILLSILQSTYFNFNNMYIFTKYITSIQ